MVSYIFGIFIAIGVFFSLFTGQVESLNNQILLGASDGINLLLEMMPLLVLWTGVMKIAEDAGILQKFSNLVRPLLQKIFPSLKRDDPALGYIASNIAANALGLGSAATPFGLKAMITFLILNTGGVTIVPTTVIALRLSHGSANPAEIIVTSILATICSSTAGLLLDYFIRKRKKR